MSKIFLSHSSTDKDFVRPIFDKFGADRCYYDEYTFEIGMQTMREIIKSLNKTDIFVVFISEAALKSDWVKDELKIAIDDFMNHKHMLRQIFPIIIDQNISCNDGRIPLYLREGDNAHNIRHVITSELAYHKIKNQLSRLELEKDNNRYLRCNLFYGRDKEKGVFKESFDAWDKNGNPQNIKCMIIAGIEGIGRKSYAKEVLKEAGIIENYYYPMMLEMSNNDSIDDLLSKLNFDLGLGEYTRKQLNSGLDVEDKIKILIELFETAHKYREIIVIEDNSCLLKAKEIQWWFKKALSQMANRIAVVIVSQNKLDKYKCKKDKELFYIELDNLPLNVACGLLRILSKNQEIPFSDEDIYSFRDVITGYPPQIIRCVEIAKAEESIDIAKEQKEEIRRVANNASAKMLNLIIDEKNREDVQSFLAFFAKLGVVPATFMNEIAKKNEVYKSVFERINEFAICTRSGSDDSYKLNAVIRDYIQRTGYTVGPELKIELEKIVTNFMQNINKDDYINNLTSAEFTYAIVEMFKKIKIL